MLDLLWLLIRPRSCHWWTKRRTRLDFVWSNRPQQRKVTYYGCWWMFHIHIHGCFSFTRSRLDLLQFTFIIFVRRYQLVRSMLPGIGQKISKVIPTLRNANSVCRLIKFQFRLNDLINNIGIKWDCWLRRLLAGWIGRDLSDYLTF